MWYDQSTMKPRSEHKKSSKDTAHSFAAKEFVYHEKNHYWYIGVGVLLLGFLFLTIQSQDYLMSAVVVAIGVAVFRLAGLKPGSRNLEVTSKGVCWGDKFIGFHQIKNFWVADINGQAHVYLDQLGFRPTLSFVIPASKIESVVTLLVSHLPHHPHRNEPVSDKLNRLLRL